MRRVFLDANILFTAAHNPDGKAALVMELGSGGYFTLVTSAYAQEEARRNLEIKYPQCIPAFSSLMAAVTIIAVNPSAHCPEILPEKDKDIFRAAFSCGARHLLTGDLKHFGPLMNRPELSSGIIIETVGEFLANLR